MSLVKTTMSVATALMMAFSAHIAWADGHDSQSISEMVDEAKSHLDGVPESLKKPLQQANAVEHDESFSTNLNQDMQEKAHEKKEAKMAEMEDKVKDMEHDATKDMDHVEDKVDGYGDEMKEGMDDQADEAKDKVDGLF
ncbi:hypothetical protein VST7929_01953 [Vibrio stylophorae]|uniref:Uncharacterized protein n=1 Tax=Vibrio stylophorae TaxID=659351 RepID=A0ABN8DVI2_9VIBR|nr:hypothetical protein [Vibrio stylophorae]CAH0534052.1 hypothetical protein VST7929_01953 [Vibrio stylophorae]